MITRSATDLQPETWQQILSNSIRSSEALLQAVGIPADRLKITADHDNTFPVLVPSPYLARVRYGDENDPLLQQILPLAEEGQLTPGYSADPLQENDANPVPGLIHKYHGRLLLILTGHCAINCRYCFRRHFPYQENSNSSASWERALDYIRDDTNLTEVIFSGGDPLVNSDKRLEDITQRIADIPHVQRLRIHSRLPIVIPQRITDEMIGWLTSTRLQTLMVIHSNHPNELDENVASSMRSLRAAGVTLLNQSVLLKGINDSVPVLEALSLKLFDMGVLPYYLHVLDKVQGAAHFDMPDQQAQQLVGQLAGRLPGYLLPRLVREEANASAKTPLPPIL